MWKRLRKNKMFWKVFIVISFLYMTTNYFYRYFTTNYSSAKAKNIDFIGSIIFSICLVINFVELMQYIKVRKARNNK